VIERNARLEAELVASLLDLSQIAAGKVRLDAKRIDLTALTRAVVESCRPASNEKDLSLDLELPSSPIQIDGDSHRLHQVISNILTNALKFTPNGGHVRVRLNDDGLQAKIQVIDDGEGIAPEFLPHVFDRFRQEDSGNGRVHGGLGLGLAIVRELVCAHDGTVAVESQGKGKGSTFTVILPMSPAVSTPPKATNVFVRDGVFKKSPNREGATSPPAPA
jgi:signal transduction histidine kinase